jgi:HPt (histidine-containing phosphotransfer) domain-containing protein
MPENTSLDSVLLDDYKASLGLDIVSDMLDLYVNQSALYLADIKLAASSGDNQEWYDKCHKMKGAASSAGLVNVRAYLVEIEHSKAEASVKADYCQALTRLNDEAIIHFKAWLEV